MIEIRITADAFSPDTEIARFAAQRGGDCGVLVTFVGYCRNQSKHGAVTQLELEHYPGFTEAEIERLVRGVAGRRSIADILVIHRTGAVPASDAIVAVAVMSAHRAAAFAAAEELMDYLKTDAPFWKREIGPDGARWIEPTAEDRARREEHR